MGDKAVHSSEKVPWKAVRHPPHMEKLCMRFMTCITLKWLEFIKTETYKYIIMLYDVLNQFS